MIVLEAMDIDVGSSVCYEDSGGDLDSEEWNSFMEWYESLIVGGTSF